MATAFAVILQSIVHLFATGPFGDLDSVVDLDRSNGIPDIVSTMAIIIACTGAAVLARRERRWKRVSAALLCGCLWVIAFDDLVGVDKDVKAYATLTATGIAIVVTGALAAVDRPTGTRPAVVMLSGLLALVGTLAFGQLPEIVPWFERARGDWLIELQIIIKQGLELAGWSLVALAVWDIALAARGSRAAAQLRR